MAIAEIDLRRDLPKVRENWDALMAGRGECSYSAPCAVGVMLPESARKTLLELRRDTYQVERLLEGGALSAPPGQWRDIQRLQRTFDGGELCGFNSILAELEAKYLTSGDK